MTPLPLMLYGAASGLLEPLAPALLRARAAKGKKAAGTEAPKRRAAAG